MDAISRAAALLGESAQSRRRTLVMGILNVTPDSFSDGGAFNDIESGSSQAARLLDAGADIIDVGGESTRPGAAEVSVSEEISRVVPTIESILRASPAALISIDTTKAVVAEAALAAGASIINDVSALTFDPELGAVAAAHGAPVVLMHIQGTPRTMQDQPTYNDVVDDVRAWLDARVEVACDIGIDPSRIVIDPGFGFGKTMAHNYTLLRRLEELSGRQPLLAGTSRKSMIGKLLNKPAGQREFGTAATVAIAIANGADIVRVHDVATMSDVVRVSDATRYGAPEGG